MNALFSLLAWAAVAVIAAVGLPVLLVVRAVDRTPGRLRTGRAFRVIGSLTTRLNPGWRITISGVDPATLDHPYVVVANHLSQADIPLISLLPWEMKWVAKQELFEVPVLGWMMRLAQDIPVDRADPDSRKTVLLRAHDRIRRGASVMFFAEGTRARDGRLKKFHDGAFRLAVQAGVPVLPLAIDGTEGALPKKSWRFGEVDVRLAVLPPVPTDGLTEADVPALRDHVRGVIRAQVAAWRGLPEAAIDALAEAPLEPGEERAKSAAPSPSRGGGG